MKKILALLFVLVFLTGCAVEEAPDTTAQQSDPIATTQQTEPTAAPTEPMEVEKLDPEWEWLLEEPTGPEATKVTLELNKESLAAHLDFYFLLHRSSDAAYLDAIAASRNFTVTSFTQTDGEVIAEVTVTVPDVYATLTAMDLSAYTTAEETDAALCSAIESAIPQEKQVTITFTAGPNRWIPVLDADATDACYGGLMTYLQEVMEGVE